MACQLFDAICTVDPNGFKAHNSTEKQQSFALLTIRVKKKLTDDLSARSTVQVMACRLFGVKPLTEPRLALNQLHRWVQTSMKFWSKYTILLSIKCLWMCRLLHYKATILFFRVVTQSCHGSPSSCQRAQSEQPLATLMRLVGKPSLTFWCHRLFN